jgi:hypothetical protein
MYKKITKWQRRLHALIETIYDAYGLPYDFNLHTTLTGFPTDEEAHEAYNAYASKMMLQAAMRDFPLNPSELERKALERAQTDDFPDQLILKPMSESKPHYTKEQRMPYRMMAEYVDRKKKSSKVKPKRKIVKKKPCGCK